MIGRLVTPARSATWPLVPLALGCLLSLGFYYRDNAPRTLRGLNDFLGFYTGARLAGTPEQFCAACYVREHLAITGWTEPAVLYTRLPAFAFPLRPLAKLPYLTAYAVWQAAALAALLLFIVIWPAPNRRVLLFAMCCSCPLAASFINGQDIPFLLLLVAITWRLHASRPILAGAILALCAVKFHLFLLLPLFLIVQRRWRILAGAGAMGGVILAGCFAIAGRGWVVEYVRFVMAEQVSPDIRSMPNLHALVAGLRYSTALELAGAALVAVAVAWISSRTDFSIGMSAALIGSLLVSHHAYLADALLLLPALLTVVAESSGSLRRLLCAVLLSPLPFLVSAKVPLAAPLPLLLGTLLAAMAKPGRRPLSAEGCSESWYDSGYAEGSGNRRSSAAGMVTGSSTARRWEVLGAE